MSAKQAKTLLFSPEVGRMLATAGLSGIMLAYYLPNTIFLNKFREVTQCYKNGLPVPVSSKVCSLVAEVMEEMKLNSKDRQQLSTYTSYGYDFFRAGTTMTNNGSTLGIPSNFKYSNIEEFEHSGVVVNNEPVPWSTQEGQSLKESLVLSEAAKKFAIARELASLTTGEPFVNGLISSVMAFATYIMATGINHRMGYHNKPRSLRLILYTLISLLNLTLWAAMTDFTAISYEQEADKRAADTGESYAKGGLEYYEKVLQRNVALRTLMGSTGERLYTAFGNDEVLIRTKHLPFTNRRDYMKARVEEYTVKNTDEAKTETESKS